MLKIVGAKGIAEIIMLFAIVMAAGFLLAIAVVKTSQVSIIYDSLGNPKFEIISYVMDAALGSAAVLIILRRHKKHSNGRLFLIFEGIVIIFTSFFVFLLIFALLLPGYVQNGLVYALAVALAGILVVLKDKVPRLRDSATMISSMGVGVILGFNFGFNYVIGILAAVAIYDYILVFKTKEMQSLAKEFSSRNMAFLISVSDLESLPREDMSKKEYRNYISSLEKNHEVNDPKFVNILKKGRLPVISQISLGEGDLSLPLMAAISAYYFLPNFAMSLLIILGSFIGIIVTMLILRIYKHPLPAVPPLFSFISIFAGIGFIITKTGSGYLPSILIAIGAAVMLIDMLTVVKKMHSLRKIEQELMHKPKRQPKRIDNNK